MLPYSESHPRYAYARAFVTTATNADEAAETEPYKLEVWQVILTQARELYLVCYIVMEPVSEIPSTAEDPTSLGRYGPKLRQTSGLNASQISPPRHIHTPYTATPPSVTIEVLGIRREIKKKKRIVTLAASVQSLKLDDILAVGSMNEKETRVLRDMMDDHPDLKDKMPAVENPG